MRDGWAVPPGTPSSQENGIFSLKFKEKLIFLTAYVRLNIVQANRLQNALRHLGEALRETETALEEMRAESDPLAVHIFVSRRQYRNMPDTKSGKRSETVARMSWQAACDLGFRGRLSEWERLMGAAIKR